MNGITSRRQFLRRSFHYGVAATAGAAAAVSGLQALAPQKLSAATPPTHSWPWPHGKMDPEMAMKRAYEGYSKGG
jgi:hypothetical protein